MADYSSMSDADLLKLVQPQQSAAPDYKGMSDADLMKLVQPQAPPAATGKDVSQSYGSAVNKGLINFAGLPGNLASVLNQGVDSAMGKLGLKPSAPTDYNLGTSSQIQGAYEKKLGHPLYQPQSALGKDVGAVTESAANPASYLGPGGPLLKIAGAGLSGLGSELAGQATEGTGYETPARIAGAVAGGAAAAKTLGPAAAKAAIPTAAELKAAATSGYDAARNSGLELDPKGVASWASKTQQDLHADGFTGGKYGTAPKTSAALDELQNPPSGATILPQNIDTVRKTLGNIAKDVQPTAGGAIVATQDAAAASKALKELGSYTENIPPSHVLAGDAAAYVRSTKQANADYGAYARVRDYDARLTKAENATDRQIAGSLDAQIKSKSGQMLDRGARGLVDPEKAQLQLINSGGPVSNTLRQLGRGGAGVVPMGLHLLAAVGTGGASIPASLGIGVPLYAARKASEAITKSRANKLVEMLAQRSPEYQQRVASLPYVSTAPNKAAIVRALLAAH